MSWRETLSPVQMIRVALVAPAANGHAMLEEVALSAVVELDLPFAPGDDAEEIERVFQVAVVSDPFVGFAGWAPAREVSSLAERLLPLGAVVVPLRHPVGVQPPTLLTGPGRPSTMSRTLVDTYGTVPYRDVDPSRLAGIAYVVMFGIMFGDVGHGAVLALLGLLLRTGWIKRLDALKRAWLFVTGAGLAAIVFGFLYGEAFGPTGLIPVIWLSPLDEPVPLLIAAIIFGAGLLAISYLIGTINRVREGGWGYALYARTGVAGSLLFVAVGLLALGIVESMEPFIVGATILAIAALILIFIGLFVDAGGRVAGAIQASVELLDTVIQLGSNVASFARLAAFGLTHAALLMVVWQGTQALWSPGWGYVAAVLLFLVGNVLTFALEALVAGIQALRLEYYEIFSRIFAAEGRQFRPWAPAVPTPSTDLVGSINERVGVPADSQPEGSRS
ncbi:V-type ATPase 116kDa subunit family protein [Salinibacterium sp. TMP30]|uniref:V-type ATPase 116kDa subunit family protein n=1 Tax=Salinibacterium sp. TMP30 TaxID=3138237 RepID=UPI003138B082